MLSVSTWEKCPWSTSTLTWHVNSEASFVLAPQRQDRCRAKATHREMNMVLMRVLLCGRRSMSPSRTAPATT